MDMESISPAWSTTSDQAWEHMVLQALNARRGDSDTRVASGTHRDPRLKFLIGQQLIKICNGARQTLLKHSAGLPIEQLLGATKCRAGAAPDRPPAAAGERCASASQSDRSPS